MSTFAVTNNDELLGAVNYALSNLGQGSAGNIAIPGNVLVANTTTGIVTTVDGGDLAYSYLYEFINIRYANSADGSSDFSTSPTNKSYFGVYNSQSSTPSNNPSQYSWYGVSGGFGTDKELYYLTNGGRQVTFVVANSAPSSFFTESVANVAIDLNLVSAANGTPGPRGALGMAYVVTPSDPTVATSATLTLWFEAARNNVTAPIGTGLIPVTGDTATFTYEAGVNKPSATYSYNGSVWVDVVGQVISGNTIVQGSIFGNAIANSTITGTLIAGNTITGNLISVGTITGNLISSNTITGNLIAANTITGTTIQSGTITGNLIAANTITGNSIVINTITGNLIAASTITGNLIAANTITGNLIAASTITGNLIAANTVVATNIQTGTLTTNLFTANTISGNIISAGSITVDKLAANVLTANTVVSTGATLGNFSSPGFWLDGNTGNARFGNTVSIGGNLSVQGLITSGNLDSSTVNTTTLVNQSVNQLVWAGPDYPGTYVVPFVSSATVSNAWPDNTRGFAISSGVSILPTTTGQLGGSQMVINYNASVYSSNPTYNIVELWKSGASSTYDQTFLCSSSTYKTAVGFTTTGNIIIGGTNGYYGYSSDNGVNWTISQDTTGGAENNVFEAATPARQITTSLSGAVNFASLSGNIYNYPPGSPSGVTSTPAYNLYGGCQLWSYNTSYPAWSLLVGASGLINGFQANSTSGDAVSTTQYTTAFSFINDLYDVAIDWSPIGVQSNAQTATAVAVGSGGGIVRGQLTWSAAANTTPNVTNQFTGKTNPAVTVNNLYGVDCNWTEYSSGLLSSTKGNLFCAVGAQGTIITSTDGNTWTQQTSPTSETLYSVAYSHRNVNKSSLSDGCWVAVGTNSTIIVSTDGTATSWNVVSSLPASTNALPRDLYTVKFSSNGSGNAWIAAGESIIYRSTTLIPSSGTNWTRVYDNGASATSALTRLAYFGSWGNVQTTTQPSNAAQINNQIINASYADVDYTAGEAVTYYLVVGNMAGNAVSTQSPTLTVNEQKR